MAKNGRDSILDEKARVTRRKIMVESTKLFARQGYHKTTVTDIANAIGMTQGALFHHFPNKEAVLYAVVDRLARGFEDYREVMDEGGAAETVKRVLCLMVKHFDNQPEATVCLAALATEFAGTEHPILEEIRRAYDSFVEPFAVVLASHSKIGEPRAAAIAFMGAAQGIAIQGLLREGDPPLEDLAQAFLSMLSMPEER